MATVLEEVAEQRFVLYGVPWSDYLRMLRLMERRHVRLTYDRGDLEIMSPPPRHEVFTTLLDQLILEVFNEVGMPRLSLGSTTFKQRRKKRGLEPDRCFYIQNEPVMRGKDKIDLRTDPPPDLAIEVEVSRSALDRMAVYAGLGVPEVWRCDGETLTVHVLGDDGKYHPVEQSRALPFLPMQELVRFLRQRAQVDETTLIRSFREWVRRQNWPRPT
jgi:Uma2 family endonuclease